jgi:CRISPR-associated protein Cas2
MFDLPMETSSEKKHYRHFVKFLKEVGFIMLQKSVYIKLHINSSSLDAQRKTLLKNLPPNGFVSVLNITENQFQSMDNLLGDMSTDIIENDSRYIEL